MFRERFASNTTEYWLARLDEQDLLCAPVLTLAEALGHEQTKANGTVVTLQGGGQAMPLIGTPLGMGPGAFRIRRPPPALGADGEAVLAEAGYPAARIAALQKRGRRRMSVLFDDRGPRRARHDRSARSPQRGRPGDRSGTDPHLGGDRGRPRSARRRADRRAASARSAPAPT